MNMSHIQEKDFDYENVRKLYFQELRVIDKTRLFPSNILWKMQLLYNKILEIKMSNKSTKMNEVITVDGEDWLVLKRSDTSAPIVRLLPAEFCFDIIAKAHIDSGHGNMEATASAIDSKYVYPKFCIPIVLKYCNICRCSATPINKASLKGNWYISLNEMTNAGDTFKYVMIYMEQGSGYTFIRPLMSKSVDEVAFELFKIFLVFGSPKKLFMCKEILDFMHMVSDKLLTLCPLLMFRLLQLRFNVVTLKRNTKSIVNSLKNWMKENGCDKWELGCHIVQWKINTTFKKITFYDKRKYDCIINIPYDSFFGHQVNVFNYISYNEVSSEYTKRDINMDKVRLPEYCIAEKSNDTEESSIVDIKKIYTLCYICKKKLLVQYKCQVCKNPLHSECGTIIKYLLNRKFIYTVRCNSCLFCNTLLSSSSSSSPSF